jgi:tRNA-dihydrouridine synthase
MIKKVDCLKKGIILSELAGYTDGRFCASNGKGASLVMLGTYIIDSSESVNYPHGFVFKPGSDNYYSYLAENITKAKESGAKVGVSAVSIRFKDSLEFLLAAQDAGADFASYCAHSTMEMFISNNTSSALLLRKNWGELKKLIRRMLKNIEIPLIFKIGAFDNPDVIDTVDLLKEEGISIIHVNIKSKPKNAGIEFLWNLNKANMVIIAGSGIRDIRSAARILETGVDALSIGTAAIKNPGICGNLQKLIRQNQIILP